MERPLAFELNAESQAIMACIDALERSHAEARMERIDLRSYLNDVPNKFRQSALLELVRVDYERQWKRGTLRSIAEYIDEYPELRDSEDSVLKLLHEEFEFRLKIGERPSVDEYRKIHPGFTPQVDFDPNDPAIRTQPLSSTATTPSLEQPKHIGKYKVVRTLGTGGFGVVYQGYDEQLERHVAIKLSKETGTKSALKGLLHEARSCASLDHPSIVKLLEVGETENNQIYVVYEFVKGLTLHGHIHKGDYDFGQAAEWIAQVAEALHYAHKRGIVHRDVKPANILIDPTSRARVVDFGLSSRNDQFYANDRGRVLGTWAYLSPEQARGDSHWASAQSDVYSLGVVLFETLCRRLPFHGKNSRELLDQVTHRAPPPPRSIDDNIPKNLEVVCLKALSKEPQQRYTTGADMAAALRAAIQPHGSRLSKIVRIAAVVAALAAGGILMFALTSSKSVPPTIPSPPQITHFNLYLPNFVPLTREDLPLTSAKHLQLQVPLDPPGYAYLLTYENHSEGRLLWPNDENALQNQHKTNLFTYPPASGSDQVLAVPNSDGVSLILVLVSAQPLQKTELDGLLKTAPNLQITAQESAHLKAAFDLIDRAPKARTDFPLRGNAPEGYPSVSESFKQLLRGQEIEQRTFYGMILPHAKASMTQD